MKTQIIQEFIDFAEGRMSFENFKNNYEKSSYYKDILEDRGPAEKFYCFAGGTVNAHLRLFDWETRAGKSVVHKDIVRYLEYYGFKINPTKKYEEAYLFLLDIQPSYVHIRDESFLEKLIESAPKGVSQAKLKKWLKDKIKELFQYEDKKPRWIQDPEWPIVNGKPLVFRYQSRQVKNDERVNYYFYDPETMEETVITQFY